MHCLLFALWATSVEEPEPLVAQESKMNAHLMAVVSVYTSIVHDDCVMRSIHDLCLSVVLLFYCNCYSVITSHLVYSWNCLLPQKCFRFYITVLMFYKWCTSCLRIICSTLVMKAQSLNFILSHYYMNFSLEEISLWTLVNHFSSSLPAEKMIVNCDCEFSCIYLSFHSDFVQTICCVLRDLHADSPVGCFHWTSWLLCPIPLGWSKTWSWTGSIYCFLHWVHFIYSCVPLTLAITSGVRLDNTLDLKDCWLWISWTKNSHNNYLSRSLDLPICPQSTQNIWTVGISESQDQKVNIIRH